MNAKKAENWQTCKEIAGTLLTAKNTVDKSLTKHKPKLSNQWPFTSLKDLCQIHTICELNNNF
jgi:hypothetical protein